MEFLENHPLAPYTTFKVGGPARWYCRPENSTDLAAAFAFAGEREIPFFRLGGGSNILVHDNGYPGLVIHLTGLDGLSREDDRIRSGAGVTVARVCELAATSGLSGLEFAGGLPGSIGGAVYMNARAYGGSFSDVVEAVQVMDTEGNEWTLTREEMGYAYKKSRLMESDETAFAIVLKLLPGDPARIRSATEENRQKRIAGNQFRYPNAGCVFKNNYDIGIPSGKLIDMCGLLGTREGDAEVLPEHGNFIVNRGNASAREIRKLIETVRKKVMQEKGVLLEEEIRYLGFPEADLPA